MLNYKVTCDNCMTTILLTEESLMQSSSIVCPKCDSKLPANEMKHLKSDLQYRENYFFSLRSITGLPIESLRK